MADDGIADDATNQLTAAMAALSTALQAAADARGGVAGGSRGGRRAATPRTAAETFFTGQGVGISRGGGGRTNIGGVAGEVLIAGGLSRGRAAFSRAGMAGLGIAAASNAISAFQTEATGVNVGGARASTAAANMTTSLFDSVTRGMYSAYSSEAQKLSIRERVDNRAGNILNKFMDQARASGAPASEGDLGTMAQAALSYSVRVESDRQKVREVVSKKGAQGTELQKLADKWWDVNSLQSRIYVGSDANKARNFVLMLEKQQEAVTELIQIRKNLDKTR